MSSHNVLIFLAVFLLVSGVVLSGLPGWVSTLLYAGSAIASLEAVHVARKAGGAA